MKTKTQAELLRLSRTLPDKELDGLLNLVEGKELTDSIFKILLDKRLVGVNRKNGRAFVTPKGWRWLHKIMSANFEMMFRAINHPSTKHLYSKEGYIKWMNISGYYMTKYEMNGVKTDGSL